MPGVYAREEEGGGRAEKAGRVHVTSKFCLKWLLSRRAVLDLRRTP